MRLSRLVTAAAFAALALSACAQNPNTASLPDEPTNEAQDSAPDRASDPRRNLPSLDDQASQDAGAPLSESEQAAVLARHPNLDPKHEIPRSLLAVALKYFDEHASSIKNKAYLSVIDFALSSTQQRFWIINMADGSVFATTVAHGKNSDPNNDGFATKFSNVEDSETSSLGIYMTAETYSGSHGLSLRLDGLSPTNSNVRSRAIVVHGADYVQDKDVKQGRSWGCPAIPMAYRDRIVGWLKNGSVIYAGLSTTPAAR